MTPEAITSEPEQPVDDPPQGVATLLTRGRIEQIQVDADFARSHLDRARTTVEQAALLTDSAIRERLHYEATLHAALGLLAHDGYRLKSGPGHHEAAVLYLAARLVGDPAVEQAARSVDALRRTRNAELYRAREVGAQAAAASEATAATIVDAVAHLLADS